MSDGPKRSAGSPPRTPRSHDCHARLRVRSIWPTCSSAWRDLKRALRCRSPRETRSLFRRTPDQLEQLFINLVRNAVDATLESGGGVHLMWQRAHQHIAVHVDDEGPGLANTTNLFVPFFTTKPEGSGIGLVLSRQIAEAHGGSLMLGPRQGMRGTRATVLLPRGGMRD